MGRLGKVDKPGGGLGRGGRGRGLGGGWGLGPTGRWGGRGGGMIRSWGLKDVSKQEIEKRKMTHEGKKKRKLDAQSKKNPKPEESVEGRNGEGGGYTS